MLDVDSRMLDEAQEIGIAEKSDFHHHSLNLFQMFEYNDYRVCLYFDLNGSIPVSVSTALIKTVFAECQFH